jgi:hypothetical protein
MREGQAVEPNVPAVLYRADPAVLSFDVLSSRGNCMGIIGVTIWWHHMQDNAV